MAEENAQKVNKEPKDSKTKNSKQSCLFVDGKSLNILAATTANIIADQFQNEELAMLSIFLSTLGSNLATIIASNALINASNNEVISIEHRAL